MTLVEFLLVRIAEDEAAANHADWAMQHQWFTTADDKVDEHVRRLSPARVLAECEAKRRIVELLAARDEQDHPAVAAHATGLRLAAKALALVYADHPDYDEAWRP